MQFNIKEAVKYSSALKEMIRKVKDSLYVTSALTNRYGDMGEINNIPAVSNGLYKATITRQKSKISNEVGKTLNDEIDILETKSEFTKLSPEVRIQILLDLITERNNIDFEIEKIKNSSTINDAFSGKDLTYDLGCQINATYRELAKTLEPLVDMEKTLVTTTNEKTTVVAGNGEQAISSNVSYPVEIKAESLVSSSEVLKMKDDINSKCKINSNQLSVIEISKYFDYAPRFNLEPTIRSLVEMYS